MSKTLILITIQFTSFCAIGIAAPPDAGFFVKEYWYERGVENGNPDFNSRFRVNAPESVLHTTFKNRTETRGNGMMLIRADEDLSRISRAELYVELWGGHPGTTNKRAIINGRSQHSIPEVGTAANHCAHQYPSIPLKITDLVNGYNAVQFACDQGNAFWGHFIVDNACLRLTLGQEHPVLRAAPFNNFEAKLSAAAVANNPEIIRLQLECDTAAKAAIASVEFQGFYHGYDENGGGQETDWHGFTKRRVLMAILGSVRQPPFGVEWDVRMLPAQSNMAARALVRFKNETNLVFLSAPLTGLAVPERKNASVVLIGASDLPQPFWSRAGRTNRCHIHLNLDPEKIENAELHVVTWDGGAGNVKNYFTLNGTPLLVAGNGRHDVIYSNLKLDPKILRNGRNEIQVLSDTDHHGIEVLLPGPALMIRYRQ